MVDSDDSLTAGRGFSSKPFFLLLQHLLGRLLLVGLLTAFESVLCFPGEHHGFIGDIPYAFRRFEQIVFVSYAVFIGLGYSKLRTYDEIVPFSRVFFAAHLLCVGSVAFSSFIPLNLINWHISADTATTTRNTLYLAAAVLLALACVPLRVWIRTVRVTKRLWLCALIAGVAAWSLNRPLWSLWTVLTKDQGQIFQIVTFNLALPLLRVFLPNVTSDPSTLTLGTPYFSIIVMGGCSGLEGIGLVLVFGVSWLWYFRKDIRFPRALILIPCALICIWLLNVVRLCALILIGNSVSPEVAMIGFHSRAGWIAFTFVALSFSIACQKLSWLHKASPTYSSTSDLTQNPELDTRESPAIRAFLLPFLAILAATFVSKAVSGYFEWLYPLRFFVATIVLWHFWPELKKLNWRFGWTSPLIGTVVFLMWVSPTLWSHRFSPSAIGNSLAALSPLGRYLWIIFRVAAAAVTVPLAEELAFRGYLERRFVNREFDQVPFASVTAYSIAFSSIAFGLMHGQHWVLGILAGVAYSIALRRRGRIGDAVVAHAISNLLLATWVLRFGDWAQW